MLDCWMWPLNHNLFSSERQEKTIIIYGAVKYWVFPNLPHNSGSLNCILHLVVKWLNKTCDQKKTFPGAWYIANDVFLSWATYRKIINFWSMKVKRIIGWHVIKWLVATQPWHKQLKVLHIKMVPDVQPFVSPCGGNGNSQLCPWKSIQGSHTYQDSSTTYSWTKSAHTCNTMVVAMLRSDLDHWIRSPIDCNSI